MTNKVDQVTFLNPQTCGIYKNGGPRYKIDLQTGQRTTELDNQLLEQVDAYINGTSHPGVTAASVHQTIDRKILVPTYYDHRYNSGILEFLKKHRLDGTTLGELLDLGIISERRGHGSPPNDQRSGDIPYVKVSDIRGLRVNVNPTNLVTRTVATRFWRGQTSGLRAWDLITPNRASSNIGEFAILVPGEEQIVLTKEMFVFRVSGDNPFDPFYLIWSFSLNVVREQWRRITLMQTNREDCGDRYREIIIPVPRDLAWARESSSAISSYLQTIALAKQGLMRNLSEDPFEYVANVFAAPPKAV